MTEGSGVTDDDVEELRARVAELERRIGAEPEPAKQAVERAAGLV